ncbi:tetratricopeptide repeat protein [Defluviimonas salinarum]|uniref:TolB amino-terminal domain-containing protein n=1 Tax=Defluviimonas salinarum TaxID=2992147 RepID=A0ABT3J6U8_9RHOB|nr:hypothetical protein [Defluviimonas salinarum]MCW3783408.1 hypothetical protein [Defluviimonas salinarum]
MPRRQTSKVPELTEESIRRQLDRILSYKELQASVRRREMLTYVVEESLAGRDDEIKATTIAMAVFGRGSDFDQQADPVVRLEARKLRRDLDNYYAESGRDDPIRISIPKGRYIPRFTAQGVIQPDESPPASEPADAGYRTSRSQTWFNARNGLIAVACTAIVAAVLAWNARPDRNSPLPAARDAETVAILIEDFDARTDEEVVSLVAAGLTHEIASALIRFPDLAVHMAPDQFISVSETSTPPSKSPTTDFMVTGDVWREDSDLFVRAELIRSKDLEILWSERYAGGAEGQGITDILDSISSEIASAIGQQYGYAMRDVRAQRLPRSNDPSLRGFACVASAQIYRRTYHRDEYQAVRECLEATVVETPDYVRAWAMLAYLRNDAARFGHENVLSREDAFELARQAATRAIDLDPLDTDALQAMSHVEQYAGDIERSIEFARRAVEVNPNDPAALANLAIRYGIAGRFSEGVPIMHRAIDRSIAPPPFYFHLLAADHLMKKEWPAMLSAAERASRDGWSFGQAMLAIAYTKLSNGQAALEAFERMAELDPPLAEDPRAWLEGHNMPQVLVEAVLAGLSDARAAFPE